MTAWYGLVPVGLVGLIALAAWIFRDRNRPRGPHPDDPRKGWGG